MPAEFRSLLRCLVRVSPADRAALAEALGVRLLPPRVMARLRCVLTQRVDARVNRRASREHSEHSRAIHRDLASKINGVRDALRAALADDFTAEMLRGIRSRPTRFDPAKADPALQFEAWARVEPGAVDAFLEELERWYAITAYGAGAAPRRGRRTDWNRRFTVEKLHGIALEVSPDAERADVLEFLRIAFSCAGEDLPQDNEKLIALLPTE